MENVAVHVIWYTAMSMDGRIASANNGLGFLESIKPGEGSEGFAEFLADIDAVVVGAATLRWLLNGGHGWPHDDLPTWLISKTDGLVERVGSTRQPLRRRAGDIGPVFDEIEAMGFRRVWLCGGGDIAGQALAVDRVDEVRVTIAPTALGAGPALFDGGELPTCMFEPTDCRVNGNAVEVTWVRVRE
jgi:riboflavin biosynthesis pyrimidine reductase